MQVELGFKTDYAYNFSFLDFLVFY